MNPQELTLLRAEVKELRQLVNFFIRSDRYRFPRDIELPSGVNLRFSETQDEGGGTMIGTSPSQKLALWGAVPVAQQLNLGVPNRITVSGTGDDADINTNFSAIQSKFDDLDQILTDIGITAEAP